MKLLFIKVRRFFTRKSSILVAILMVASATTTVRAQIAVPGVPMLVFDPTVLAKLGEELLQVIQVATATAATVTQLTYDAKYLTNKYALRGAVLNGLANVTNYFHATPVTQPWAQATLTGLGAVRGYSQAALTLENNPTMVVMGDPRTPFYATAQIGAANNTRALQALGDATQFSIKSQAAINACQDKATSNAPDDNTRAAQQNIANECAALVLQHQQAQLGLENARLGVELFESKLQADTLAEHLNIYTDAENAKVMRPSNLTGLDDTLRTAVIH